MKKSSKGISEQIIRASVVIGIAHLLLKVSGFVQAKAAAHYLDEMNYSVILVTAFTGVITSLFLIGEESIGPSFLPIFMQEKDDKGEKEAFNFVNALLSMQLFILLGAVLVVMCFPNLVITIFTEWSSVNNPKKYELLRTSIVYLAPCLFFLSIGSTTYMLLNGYKKFFLAAIGDASTKICLVIALVVGIGIFKFDTKVIYFGLIVGSMLKVATHFCGLFGKVSLFRLNFNFSSSAMKSFYLLILPLLVGILIAKFRDIFNNIRILTHLKDDLMIMQANDLGRKLFASISWLVPYTLQIALFPFLCELVDRNDSKKLGEILTGSVRLMLALFIPGALLLFVLSQEISFGLFFSGKLEVYTAMATTMAMSCYFLVLPAQAVECVMMQGFFAKKKMILVTAIGVSCSLISVVISYVCIVSLEMRGIEALMAMALGFVFSRSLKSVILVFFLRRSIPMFPIKETGMFLARLSLLALLVAGATYGAKEGCGLLIKDNVTAACDYSKESRAKQVFGDAKVKINKKCLVEQGIAVSSMKSLLKAMIAGLVGGVVYLLGAFLLKIKEPFTVFKWFLDRLPKRA